MPLANLVADEILDERDLPLRFTAWHPVLSLGSRSRGQGHPRHDPPAPVHKVELVSITTPEQSAAEHERMTACAEEVLKRLGLAYRVVAVVDRRYGFRRAEDL